MVVLRKGDWVLVGDVGEAYKVDAIYNNHVFLLKNGRKEGFRFLHELTKIDEAVAKILTSVNQ